MSSGRPANVGTIRGVGRVLSGAYWHAVDTGLFPPLEATEAAIGRLLTWLPGDAKRNKGKLQQLRREVYGEEGPPLEPRWELLFVFRMILAKLASGDDEIGIRTVGSVLGAADVVHRQAFLAEGLDYGQAGDRAAEIVDRDYDAGYRAYDP